MRGLVAILVFCAMAGFVASEVEACDNACAVQAYIAPQVQQVIVPQVEYQYVQPQAVVLHPQVAKVKVRQQVVQSYSAPIVTAPVLAVEARRPRLLGRSRIRTRSVEVRAGGY
jgi:hypothetical protein